MEQLVEIDVRYTVYGRNPEDPFDTSHVIKTGTMHCIATSGYDAENWVRDVVGRGLNSDYSYVECDAVYDEDPRS